MGEKREMGGGERKGVERGTRRKWERRARKGGHKGVIRRKETDEGEVAGRRKVSGGSGVS